MSTIVRGETSEAPASPDSAAIRPAIDDAMRRAAALLQSELRAVQVSYCDVCGHYFGAHEKRYLGVDARGDAYSFCRNEVRGHLAVLAEVAP